MWLTRARIRAKSLLRRGTPAYRLASGIYQAVERVFLPRRSSEARDVGTNSIFTEEAELPMCSLFPLKALERVMERFSPASLLDVGCGTGVSLEWFVKRGVDAWGLEGSPLAASKSKVRDRITVHDLTKPWGDERRFDLVWSFEVAEHIHPDDVECLMDVLTGHAPLVVVSAARPGQGGCGHLNEQEPAYWIGKFSARGFDYDEGESEAFRSLDEPLCENLLVFRQRTGGTSGVRSSI